MRLPHATTTISVNRSPTSDDYAEPYGGTPTEGRDEVATGVPAVIDAPRGREQVAGGEQTVMEMRLICELTDLRTLDYITDDITGETYSVTWCMTYPGEHVEAGLKQVKGLV